MDSYSVEAVLSVTDRGFTSSMNKAQESMKGLEKDSGKTNKSIMDIAKGVGVFKALSVITNSLSSALDGAIKRYDTMNRFPTVMKQMGFETEQSEQAINRLSNGIDGLPTTLDGVVSTTQRLASTTGNLDQSVDTTLALNNALIASGATTDQTARATDQYIKILSKGKVDAENWQTLSETMSYGLKEVAESFGFAGDSATNDLYAALQSGDITVKEFNGRMIELSNQTGGFAEIAQTASGGIETSFQNMQTAVVRGVEKMIRSIDEGLTANSLPNLQGVLDITKGYINDFFGAASTGAKGLISTVAPAIKTVTGNLDIIAPAVGTATAGFIAFKAATSLTGHFRSLKDSIEKTDTVLKKIKDSNAKWTISSKEAEEATRKQNEAEQAASKAYEASEKSIIAAVQANQLDETAKRASEKAAKAQAEAEKLSKVALEKKKAASKTATEQEKLNEAAKQASEAASKAQARAEMLSTEAIKKQEMAQSAGVAAAKAKTVADTAATEAEKAQAAAAESSVVQLSLKQSVLGVLRGQISATTVAQQALSAAFKANPFGMVITVISALATGFMTLNKWLIKNNDELQETKKQAEKTCSAVDDLVDSIDSSADAHEANLRNIEAEASASKTLADKITDLAKKEELSKDEKKELDAMIGQLNNSVEGLNLSYDEQTRTLNMTDEAILATVESYKEQAKAQALQERGVEILKEQMKAADELKAVEADRKEVSDQLNEATTTLFGSGKELKKTDEELAEKEEELRQRQENLTVALADNETAVRKNAVARAEAEDKVAEASETSVQRQITSLDALSEAQENTLDRVVSAYETMTGSLSDLSSKIEEDSEQTWAKVRENQADTLVKTQEFSDLYAAAIKAGISESYLNAIGVTGPEALPLLRGLMSDSIDEVLATQSEWENAYQSINSTFTDSLQLDDGQRSTVREFISGEAGVLGTLQSALDEADIPALGSTIATDTAQGIASSSVEPEEAATAMVNDTKAAAQEASDLTPQGETAGSTYAAGMNRMSGQVEDTAGLVVHKGASAAQEASAGYSKPGEDAMSTYAESVSGQQGAIKGAVKTAISGGMQAADSASSAGLANLKKNFSTEMSSISKIIDAAMKQSTQSVTTGMRNQNTQVTTGMRQIQAAASSGMSALVRAVSSGMSSSVNAVTSGKSRMVAQVNTLQSQFYSAGVYASQGLARGVNAGAGAAIAAARNVANSVAATMRSALQIHSPSKVTEKIGEYTGEGAAIGLLNMLSSVRKASDSVAQVMVPQPAIVARPACAGATSSYSDVSASRDMRIVVPVYLDGREIARAEAPYSEAERNKRNKIKNRITKGER